MNNSTYITEKWNWKMEYCKVNNIPPAQTWAWNEAEEAYQDMLDTKF